MGVVTQIAKNHVYNSNSGNMTIITTMMIMMMMMKNKCNNKQICTENRAIERRRRSLWNLKLGSTPSLL
jgi:hypothetical protein